MPSPELAVAQPPRAAADGNSTGLPASPQLVFYSVFMVEKV